MAKYTTTRTDVLEKAYAAGTVTVIRGAIILVVSLLLLYFFTMFQVESLQILAMIGVVIGIIVALLGVKTMYDARKAPVVTFACPYCDYPMQFPKDPTEDFDCDRCHRRVYFESGKLAPVVEVTCTSCKAVHRVSSMANRFICDKCNRPVNLKKKEGEEDTLAPEQTEILQNYDVLLTQVGRKPNEVGMALQDLLVCNLVEARRQMEELPLTVARNVPERKADAIRRRLRELGATAIVRPAEAADQQPGRRR